MVEYIVAEQEQQTYSGGYIVLHRSAHVRCTCYWRRQRRPVRRLVRTRSRRQRSFAGVCTTRMAWRKFSAHTQFALHARCSAGCADRRRSEEHTSELQSLMRISYAVFCLKTKNKLLN